MICNNCGQHVMEDALFCQNCGNELAHVTLDTLTRRVKQLLGDNVLEAAWYINRIYLYNYYFEKYGNFADYGQKELDMKQANVYRYRQIGEHFLDRNGNPLIPDAYSWSIARLGELVKIPISEINMLISTGTLSPNLPSKKLRAIIKEYNSNS